MLPILSLTGSTIGEQVRQIELFLYQLRESLEFELSDIDTGNLSPALRGELEKLGVSIEETKKTAEESQERSGTTANRMITISDVINSELYKASQDALVKKNIVNGEGSLILAEGVQICYGVTEEQTVTFTKAFKEVPVFIAMPTITVEITVEGFTRAETETGSYQWIAIGKYEEVTEDGTELE